MVRRLGSATDTLLWAQEGVTTQESELVQKTGPTKGPNGRNRENQTAELYAQWCNQLCQPISSGATRGLTSVMVGRDWLKGQS